MKLTKMGTLATQIMDYPKIGDEVSGRIVHMFQNNKLIIRDSENFNCRESKSLIEWKHICEHFGLVFKRGTKIEERKVINEARL